MCHFTDTPLLSTAAPIALLQRIPFPLSHLNIVTPIGHATPAIEYIVARLILSPILTTVELCITQCRSEVLEALKPLSLYVSVLIIVPLRPSDISSYKFLMTAPQLQQIVLSSATNSDIQYVLQNASDSIRALVLVVLVDSPLSSLTIQKMGETFGKKWKAFILFNAPQFDREALLQIDEMSALVETMRQKDMFVMARGGLLAKPRDRLL